MSNLRYQLHALCNRNRDGSYSTQSCRRKLLLQMANELKALGFRQLQAKSLKPKHVDRLIKHWRQNDIKDKTQANRMSVIRWWAEKINKPNIVKASNADYGIGKRSEITKVSKAAYINDDTLQQITDPYVKISLQLQQHFGLRREEAIKFMPSYADQGDHIRLQGSWTKGGRPRQVPILTQVQREILDQAKRLAGKAALIPADKNYKQQLHVFEHQTSQAGIGNTHGLRHTYAQRRYHTLTGNQAPCNGGAHYSDLTDAQRQRDLMARQQIALELGHNRIRVTNTYLGK